MTTPKRVRPSSPGIGVDAFGGQVIDPTRNVLDLVAAAINRQDDLNGLREKLYNAQMHGLEKLLDERRMYQQYIAEAHERHDALMHSTEDATTKLWMEQSGRDRELIRASVGEVRTQMATQMAASERAISERIAVVERKQYQSEGESRVADPQMDQLARDVRALIAGGDRSTGKEQGVRISMSVVGLIAAVAAALGGLIAPHLSSPQPVQQVQIPSGYVLVPSAPPQPVTQR